MIGQEHRSRVMREKWNNGSNATDCYKMRVAQLAQPGTQILHAGCGWDKLDVSRPFAATCRVVGVDLDPRVASMFHSEFHLGSVSELPFDADVFDLILCEYVAEHVDDPAAMFAEMHRVLRPGGRILMLTPSLYSYKTAAAGLTPHQFHLWMGRIRYGRGHEADMYPTLYRCNTRNRFRQLARQIGLEVVSVDTVTNGPTWFEKMPLLFEMFDLFHRGIARWEVFRQLRCALIVELHKPVRSS
jgi:ubiquinone/menaquinone biosynthesis C-methylase UbiE